MAKVEIRKTTVSYLAGEPNFHALLEEYASERALNGLPHPQEDIAAYAALESAGKLQCFGSYFDSKLIGFLNILVSNNPNYLGVKFAYSHGFFVEKMYRKTGAGNALRKIGEEYAILSGCPALLISTPKNSNMEKWLDGSKDYSPVTVTFMKILPCQI